MGFNALNKLKKLIHCDQYFQVGQYKGCHGDAAVSAHLSLH